MTETYGEPDPDAGWPQKFTAAVPVWSGERPVSAVLFDEAQAMWLRKVDELGYEPRGPIGRVLNPGIDIPDHPHRGPDVSCTTHRTTT